ncbi:MAG TPA: tetratricopeptide repeat protein [bacterium]
MLTLATFAGVAHNGFISFDDPVYLAANPEVRNGLSARSLGWALTTTQGANWHPLTWVSHLADVTLFGLAPGPHHLVSLGLHAACAVALVLFLRNLTGTLWPAAFAAALFAVHPLHVESVAWAAERKDVLALLFSLLAARAWLRGVRRPAPRHRLASLLLFALALLAKPMPVALPFLLLLLDWWPLGRWSPVSGAPPDGAPALAQLLPPPPLWREKLPLFAAAAAAALVTLFAQAGRGAMEYGEALPFARRAANAVIALATYLRKTFWPADLAIFYPYPRAAPPWWHLLGALALLAIISFLVARAARRRPHLAVGWLWFLGALMPMIGLVQVGSQAMADRYTYLPLIGPFLAIAWTLAWAARDRGAVVPLAAGTALAAFALLATRQVGFWRDDVTVFGRAAAVTRDNWLAQDSLGTAAMAAGRYAEAAERYRAALAIRPDHVGAAGNLASALLQAGEPRAAIDAYRRILRVDDSRAGTYYNLGVALAAAGETGEAAAAYRAALEREPDHLNALNNLGNILDAGGRSAEAMALYRRAVAADPGYAQARFNLGIALGRAGDAAGAAAQFREVLRANPRHARAVAALGDALQLLGRPREAADAYRTALALDPSLTGARSALALLDGPPAPGVRGTAR